MAWLVALALVVALVTGFATGMVFALARDRRRRGAGPLPEGGTDGATDRDEGSPKATELVEPAELDFVQIWLDNEWEQRFDP